ncbi:hypothetical protein [Desulforhopalus singaporensis]|uniref:Conjugal transfer protein TrbH n=1 Tax=Desulforhopalus singaporensis TaxID=91360 RepID=A0A1H0PA24_9BACT|nr:hypothetical protein [Desulforhopalus singaporensis]SDP01967.1 hypothetical protein SAMN05660330_01583 [Desulforhopalus singaporensis]
MRYLPLLFLAFLTSCAASVPDRSYVALTPAADPKTITEFILDRLVAEYPSSSEQSIYFKPSANRNFNEALESAAREAGFQVAATPSPEAVTVRYVIDSVQGTNASYISLKTDKGLIISRTFDSNTYALNTTFLRQDTQNE